MKYKVIKSECILWSHSIKITMKLSTTQYPRSEKCTPCVQLIQHNKWARDINELCRISKLRQLRGWNRNTHATATRAFSILVYAPAKHLPYGRRSVDESRAECMRWCRLLLNVLHAEWVRRENGGRSNECLHSCWRIACWCNWWSESLRALRVSVCGRLVARCLVFSYWRSRHLWRYLGAAVD